MGITLNADQWHVVTKLVEHIHSDQGNPFIVVSGYAGTGKSTCLIEVLGRTNSRVCVCATTNKAVRVLREVFTENRINQPPTCTIYSLLSLTLMPTGELKNIGGFDNEVDLSDFDCVVIDEAGMLNRKMCEYIDKVSDENPRIRWVLLGDPAQLPPVKESMSEVWSVENMLYLTRVMRTDNQILTLSTKVRSLIDKPGPLNLGSDNDGNEGVWSLSKEDFKSALVENASGFASGDYKAIAWRNATVDRMNAYIREALVGKQEDPWLVGERVSILAPIKDFMDDRIVASTDDEAVILEVTPTQHPLYRLFKVWHLRLRIEHSGLEIVAYSLHKDSADTYNKALAGMAEKAKVDRRLWKDYWNFRDAFNDLRHAYATTAHRAQGSTYEQAFVCWRDITANTNRDEMLRCLYVAVSRPKKRLYLG